MAYEMTESVKYIFLNHISLFLDFVCNSILRKKVAFYVEYENVISSEFFIERKKSN